MISEKALKKFADEAKKNISKNVPEDVLRHLFSTYLGSIFPDSPWWVKAHALGTETHVTFASRTGKKRSGFADSMVGKTAIEYEKNLGVKSIFDEGYYQVREYCAALCNRGIPPKDVLGVLSDTVRWYGFSISIKDGSKGRFLGAEDILLCKEDHIDLSVCTESQCVNFAKFVNKYFARVKSRFLNPSTLADDFGVESEVFGKVRSIFASVVKSAAKARSGYYSLIKKIWQNFVAYLGASEYGRFSERTYINEFYLITVAKILCANILKGDAIISSKDEAIRILNGDYFQAQNLDNLVDYDYFGWLNDDKYAEMLLDAVLEIQRGMQAYDFNVIAVEDLFGQLLAQLADKEHRLLLGQEFTPHQIARIIVDRVLDRLPDKDTPRMVDMCCGSGVFLIEGIKSVRDRYGISGGKSSLKKLQTLASCTLGFDIDPLAVMLAKVNWVLAMRDVFKYMKGSVNVPIYHADSLFVATPISHKMPNAADEEYVLCFDKDVVTLPQFIMSPEMRNAFDNALSSIYKLAMLRAAKNPADELKDSYVTRLVTAVEYDGDTKLTKQQEDALHTSFRQLILILEKLQREGRNGIWSFVLRNSYRPGLTSHQFNCAISNPPWLAMSKFANNPYRTVLTKKAEAYGIKPKGQSHPHLELATTFLVSAVDKYLLPGAYWGCIMPGTVINGDNHEPLRREKYRTARIPVAMRTTEIWELPAQTFKNKSVVMFGEKSAKMNPSILKGRRYTDMSKFEKSEWRLVDRGSRSAWVSDDSPILTDSEDTIHFFQGADVMPRSALFHRFIKRENGNFGIAPIDKDGDLFYLLEDGKKMCCADIVAEDFEAQFVYDCLLSKHLSPFYVASPASVIIPGVKVNDHWHALTDEELAMMNASTSAVLKRIGCAPECGGSLKVLLENKIDILKKLSKQVFPEKKWLVLSSAGGKNPCSAYVDLSKMDYRRLVIDQTLYWHLADSEDEAKFLSGILNSAALADAIKDFQPQGEFGQRHIHTLPFQVTPPYNESNRLHKMVIRATSCLMLECRALYDSSEFNRMVQPDGGRLNSRRRIIQSEIRKMKSYASYESACAKALVNNQAK